MRQFSYIKNTLYSTFYCRCMRWTAAKNLLIVLLHLPAVRLLSDSGQTCAGNRRS